MNNKSGIYKITSPSGKIYIGETVDFEKRFIRYKRLECKQQYKLYNSFNKYGVENHIFEIVEECDIDDLKCRERYWQDYYDVLSDKGMNLMLTQCGEIKRRMSKDSIERYKNTLRIKGGLYGTNNPMWGKKHSEEAKNKIRLWAIGRHKGDKNPMWGKFGKDHPAYGNKPTEEQLENARKNNLFGKNPMAKIVIDLSNGVFYESASELAAILNVNKYTLRARLCENHPLKNNTNFKYC